MSVPVIPYQVSDFVYQDEVSTRPSWPIFDSSHTSKDQEFVTTEDIPLNRRHFLYQPCSPNPLLSQLKYVTSEYPYSHAGINTMDRSDMLAVGKNSNDVVSVIETCGWRSGRCDVPIKEGVAYWEVELVEGGYPGVIDDQDDDDKRHHLQMLHSTPHVRFGVCRRESSLEAPVGCDTYGYGIRDNNMECLHNGKLSQVLLPTKLKPGDNIGFLLKLPSFQEQYDQAMAYTERMIEVLSAGNGNNGTSKKRMRNMNMEFKKSLLLNHDPKNIVRDQIAIRYKNQLFFESADFIKTNKSEYVNLENQDDKDFFSLKGSSLTVYLNGEKLGKAFENLQPYLPPFSELHYNEKFYMNHWKNHMDSIPKMGGSSQRNGILKNKYTNNGKLGYYPTISCFNGGIARIITQKSELKYYDSITDEFDTVIHTIDELYKQQIADDIVWDLVDEIEAEAVCATLQKEANL
ncbi:Bre2p Ecym_7360 [Eremothecium cymbalariae DBVPG|uniref:SPRY domain-containing protein n=1 Tax=Eremothecium cymbalariae (strain CBS 270.75 / DBVPG 7215 / KCTC 17166 / NRRL Y-17582) TaxID=931890 RepID=G8JWH2_ERECY|nr:hypothetical protein Ecym_7360 [Eremothecium cymbalariae DBVPG\